jgi:hypothetical protein
MTSQDHQFHFVGGPMDGAVITVDKVPKELIIVPAEVPVSVMVLFRAHRYTRSGKKLKRLNYKEPVTVIPNKPTSG